MEFIGERQLEYNQLVVEGKSIARAFRDGQNFNDHKAALVRIADKLSILDPNGELIGKVI